jgi:hypothetical protein
MLGTLAGLNTTHMLAGFQTALVRTQLVDGILKYYLMADVGRRLRFPPPIKRSSRQLPRLRVAMVAAAWPTLR